MLPSGARARCPGRAHPANAGWAEHRGDCPRLPGSRGDDEEATRPCEAQDQGGGNPVSRPSAPPASRPPRCNARGRLSDLQRGLRRPRGPGGRGDPAGARARRAHARRAGGARTPGPDAAERRAARSAIRRRRGRPAPRPGSIALGRSTDRRGTRGAQWRARFPRPRTVRPAGDDRRTSHGRSSGLAAARGPVRRACPRDRLLGRGAQPGCRDRRSRGGRSRARPRGAARARPLPLSARDTGGAAAPARPRRRRAFGVSPGARARRLGRRAPVPRTAAGGASRLTRPYPPRIEGGPPVEVTNAPEPRPRKSRWRRLIGVGLGIAVVAATFFFVLPRIANYGDVWAVVRELSWGQVGALLLATVLNLVTFAPPWMVALPRLGFRPAFVLTQASTASTYIAPGGAAVGVALAYAMLRGWGFSAGPVGLAVAVTGIWNQLALLGFPTVALALLTLKQEQNALLQTVPTIGLAVFLLAAGAFALGLSTPKFARFAGET